MRDALALVGRRVVESLRLMVGVPDYERYVRHVREAHPDRDPMNYEAFFRQRIEARYGRGKSGGCC